MRILSWNAQYGQSANNGSNFLRTLDYAKSLGEFDVICLQELARNMEGCCQPGQEDQLKLAQQHFNDYSLVWGSGFSWPSAGVDPLTRQEFGNLTLVKSNLLDYRVHQLPYPAVPGKLQTPRVAIETIVASKIGPLSIVNTHLAYHDSNETQLQLIHLNQLELERIAHLKSPKTLGPGCFQAGFSGAARLLCGDFNFEPESSHYEYQINQNWIDSWKLVCADKPQPWTCGIFDKQQWQQGPHCRDYFWLSSELASTDIKVSVDTSTDLSDHQPIIIEIDL